MKTKRYPKQLSFKAGDASPNDISISISIPARSKSPSTASADVQLPRVLSRRVVGTGAVL